MAIPRFLPPDLCCSVGTHFHKLRTLYRRTARSTEYTYVRTVAAVHDGYVLHKSVARAPLGGALLARCMLHSVESKGVTVAPSYSFRRKERAPGQFEVGPAGVSSLLSNT